LALTDFVIRNYRSVRDVWLKLERISVIVGPNGSGKSNLYRAMHLVASTATGQLARSIAEEGGMDSIRWSGKYGRLDTGFVHLSIKIDDLQYDLGCGTMPPRSLPDGSLFASDMEIKRERIFQLKNGRKSRVLDRGRAEVKARDAAGEMTDYTKRVAGNESILTGLREPHKYPLLSKLRQELINWRFYHNFRTDRDSPLRKPQFPVVTLVMAHDGSDFVSAFQTIMEMGDAQGLLDSIEDAFPGASVYVIPSRTGLRLQMQMPGFARAFDAAELSDGTLQYLCLLTALFSLDPPSLLAINEPETSIHPDLFGALAKLLVRVSKSSQIWITTHSRDLSDYILEYSGYSPLELEKVDGETRVIGVKLGSRPDPDEDDDD
jgi:predicted ATPase